MKRRCGAKSREETYASIDDAMIAAAADEDERGDTRDDCIPPLSSVGR
jgi:hypothetical protein